MEYRVHASGSPCCPGDHPGTPMLRTGDTKIWQCPISQALFEVDIDESEVDLKYDKYGNVLKTYIMKGSE